MARDDGWYRNDEWDKESQAEFSRRLARARTTSRYQYRRVKAVALLSSGDPVRREAAEHLLEENLASGDTPDHERVWALSLLARDAHERQDVETAERLFRLEFSISTESGRGAEDEVAFAEILITKGTSEALVEARDVLAQFEANPPPFLRSQFRLAVAQAKLSMLSGDAIKAAIFAKAALDLSRETNSGLAHHPRLGLVDDDEHAVAWLRSVALGNEMTGRFD